MNRFIDFLVIVACMATIIGCAALHYEAFGFAGIAAATTFATGFGCFANKALRSGDHA